MKMVFVKEGHGLRPADETSERFINRTRAGEHVMVQARKPRNIQHHRLLFAMLHKVADNLVGVSVDQLLAVIKLRTGYCDVIRTRKGEVHVPRSIAFESMDQTAFDEFYDKAVRYIISDVLPGIDREALENEVLEMVR